MLERDGLVAGCPVASRVPYEVLIAPARTEPEGLRSDLLGPRSACSQSSCGDCSACAARRSCR